MTARKGVDPLTVPSPQRTCDLLLGLKKGTTATALRLGAPSKRSLVVPNAIAEWLKAPPVQLEPIAGPDGAAMLSLDWALVPIEAARVLARPKPIDCDEDCLSRWAPSPRWKAVGPHVRVRIERGRTRTGFLREAVVIRCGACLGKLARVAVAPFRGLLAVHGSVPRVEIKRRSKEDRRVEQKAATMRREPAGAAA